MLRKKNSIIFLLLPYIVEIVNKHVRFMKFVYIDYKFMRDFSSFDIMLLQFHKNYASRFLNQNKKRL